MSLLMSRQRLSVTLLDDDNEPLGVSSLLKVGEELGSITYLHIVLQSIQLKNLYGKKYKR